jgi:hypothetical protein
MEPKVKDKKYNSFPYFFILKDYFDLKEVLKSIELQ